MDSVLRPCFIILAFQFLKGMSKGPQMSSFDAMEEDMGIKQTFILMSVTPLNVQCAIGVSSHLPPFPCQLNLLHCRRAQHPWRTARVHPHLLLQQWLLMEEKESLTLKATRCSSHCSTEAPPSLPAITPWSVPRFLTSRVWTTSKNSTPPPFAVEAWVPSSLHLLTSPRVQD